MLRSEARATLLKWFPDRTIFINITDRHYKEDRLKDDVDYCVSLMPGLDGSECTIHNGKTLEAAVEAALRFEERAPVSPEELDLQFASTEQDDDLGAPDPFNPTAHEAVTE